MGRPRTFDHEEARKLHAQGLRVSEVARALGVSWKAAKRAIDADFAADDNQMAAIRVHLGRLIDRGQVEVTGESTHMTCRGPRTTKLYRIRPNAR